MNEIYISTDIEADGPIPGPYSMISFASAAFLEDKTLIDTFSVNLETLEGASSHPDTMKWWADHQDVWEINRQNQKNPQTAMNEYVEWLEALPGRPVFVGYPAAYDFMFVYWYLIRFVGRSPFSFSALDIKTMSMVMLGRDFRRSGKGKMPKRWFDDLPHTHKAVDDAVEQGALFCNMLKESRRKH